MTIRARFSPDTKDVVTTLDWLNKSGLAEVDTWQQLYDVGVIEIQLRDTPQVLAYLSQVEDALSISRVSAEGVVFYLTDIPLWVGVPEEKQRVATDKADGFLFVPMSNVVCINTFGSVYAHTVKT